MTSSAVVSRYAGALVDIATSPNSGVDPALAIRQLRSFAAAVQSTPELSTILASPAVSAARKRLVIRRIGEALGLERIILNFILVLSDHRRAAALPEMIDSFELLLDERLGFLRAEVRSASELTGEQRDRLSAELARLAGSQVRMRFAVDPELIGGVTATVGSRVYDGSVRGQLDTLRQRLALNI
jgi:F-type H+-transporting ATPase subunit delta